MNLTGQKLLHHIALNYSSVFLKILTNVMKTQIPEEWQKKMNTEKLWNQYFFCRSVYFRVNLLSFVTLKLEAGRFSETLLCYHTTTRCLKPENCDLNLDNFPKFVTNTYIQILFKGW